MEARELTRVYGRRRVLRDLSFRAGAGELWTVLGPNGSGKSTLLKVLAGLLRPTSGETVLSVNGRDMKGPERRGCVGLLSPELSPYEELTGLENMDFAAQMRGEPRDPAVLGAALERVGLTDAAAHMAVGHYSSGMRQRLKLALDLQHRPALLLLDEPTALLDEEGRARVTEMVEAHRRQQGIVFWATNDPGELPQERREIRLSR